MKVLVSGKIDGTVSESENPINFLGTVDKKTGIISDENHFNINSGARFLGKGKVVICNCFHTGQNLTIISTNIDMRMLRLFIMIKSE